MATMKTDAQRVTELRKQAMDKSLPQEVRDMADKKANDIEGKSVEKATGVKLAKGGAVKKDAPKKMMMGGAVAKDLPMRGQRTATNMAKGGMTKKAKK
jgi:ribosomal protein S13